MQLNPKQTKTLEKAAQFISKGQPRRAKNLLDKLSKTAADNFDVIHLSGLVLYKLKRIDEGLNYLERAKAICPQNAEVRSNLASAYQALKNWIGQRLSSEKRLT